MDCDQLSLSDPRRGQCLADRFKKLNDAPISSFQQGPLGTSEAKNRLDSYLPPNPPPQNGQNKVPVRAEIRAENMVEGVDATADLSGTGLVVKLDYRADWATTIKTNFQSSASIDQVWRKIVKASRAKGQSPKDLLKEVDVGYTEDLQLVPRSYNKRGVVEETEVFEYAYARPEFYSDLVRAGFMVPFYRPDYVEKNRNINIPNSNHFAPGSDEYKLELAKAVLGDVLSRFPQTGACEGVMASLGGALSQCVIPFDALHELYGRWRLLGLHPQYYLVRNTTPSFNRLNIVRNNLSVQSDVFLFLPYQNKGFTVVENRLSETQSSDLVTMSPRQYVAAWLDNQSNKAILDGDIDEALDNVWKIAPRAIIPFIRGLAVYIGQKDWSESDQLMARLEELAPDGPERLFLKRHLTAVRQDKSDTEREKELASCSAKIPQMLKRHPVAGAYFLYQDGIWGLYAVKEYQRALQGHSVSDSMLKGYQEVVHFTRDSFYKSLKTNPNSSHAARGLIELANVTQGWDDATSVLAALLKDFPSHPSFLYIATRLNLKLWEKHQDEQYLVQAWEFGRRFAEHASNSHPQAHLLAEQVIQQLQQDKALAQRLQQFLDRLTDVQWNKVPHNVTWVEKEYGELKSIL